MLAVTYADKKELFEQASLYYYNMNVSDEGTAERIAQYEATKEWLDITRESSKSFVDSVTLYSLAEGDEEKFDALLSCYKYAQNAESTVDGVAEAREVFLQAYEAYVAECDVANAEMLAAGMMMASVGSKGGVEPILSAAFKLIFD